MFCPGCKAVIMVSDMRLEENAEEDGVEIGFRCPVCGNEYYAVLTDEDFEDFSEDD